MSKAIGLHCKCSTINDKEKNIFLTYAGALCTGYDLTTLCEIREERRSIELFFILLNLKKVLYLSMLAKKVWITDWMET